MLRNMQHYSYEYVQKELIVIRHAGEDMGASLDLDLDRLRGFGSCVVVHREEGSRMVRRSFTVWRLGGLQMECEGANDRHKLG